MPGGELTEVACEERPCIGVMWFDEMVPFDLQACSAWTERYTHLWRGSDVPVVCPGAEALGFRTLVVLAPSSEAEMAESSPWPGEAQREAAEAEMHEWIEETFAGCAAWEIAEVDCDERPCMGAIWIGDFDAPEPHCWRPLDRGGSFGAFTVSCASGMRQLGMFVPGPAQGTPPPAASAPRGAGPSRAAVRQQALADKLATSCGGRSPIGLPGR
jgi:hypothetical protein